MRNTLYESIFQDTYMKDLNNIEECLNNLKLSGASQMDCVKTLIWGLKIPLKEADRIVLESQTWVQNRDTVQSFRDDFVSHIENI